MKGELTEKEKYFLTTLFKIGTLLATDNKISFDLESSDTMEYFEQNDVFNLAEKLGIELPIIHEIN